MRSKDIVVGQLYACQYSKYGTVFPAIVVETGVKVSYYTHPRILVLSTTNYYASHNLGPQPRPFVTQATTDSLYFFNTVYTRALKSADSGIVTDIMTHFRGDYGVGLYRHDLGAANIKMPWVEYLSTRWKQQQRDYAAQQRQAAATAVATKHHAELSDLVQTIMHNFGLLDEHLPGLIRTYVPTPQELTTFRHGTTSFGMPPEALRILARVLQELGLTNDDIPALEGAS